MILFLLLGIYLFSRFIKFLQKTKVHEECVCFLTLVSILSTISYVIFMLFLFFDNFYVVGIEFKDNLLFYKNANMFGMVDQYGIKDTNYKDVNFHIKQYQDPEFDILYKEHFSHYDDTDDKYIKITLPLISVQVK